MNPKIYDVNRDEARDATQEDIDHLTRPKITYVYIWSNGQVMVFDQYGKQMPEFQDHKDVAIPKIKAAGFKGPWNRGNWQEHSIWEDPDV